MATPADVAAMRRALELAASPAAPSGPNPRVGAVIVDADGSVVGEGFHAGVGSDHAEVVALAAAGDAARGATAVVTLEPCDHHGRTGPCSVALLTAGITSVIYAQSDTGPLAAGGAERLRQGGIAVEGGVLAAEAAGLNPIFSFANDHGRPFVTYKFAASLDGRVAAADGSSRWITGDSAREDVHHLRSQVDAILVGTGTALADNPALSVRSEAGSGHQPLRVVMGMRELPEAAALRESTQPTTHLRTHDPDDVLKALNERGAHHLLVEGGPTVAAAFVRAGLVDQVVAYVAPLLLGAGLTSLADAGVATLADASRFVLTDVTLFDNDVRITASAVERM